MPLSRWCDGPEVRTCGVGVAMVATGQACRQTDLIYEIHKAMAEYVRTLTGINHHHHHHHHNNHNHHHHLQKACLKDDAVVIDERGKEVEPRAGREDVDRRADDEVVIVPAALHILFHRKRQPDGGH